MSGPGEERPWAGGEPGSGAEARPADAVRRALRAAREQERTAAAATERAPRLEDTGPAVSGAGVSAADPREAARPGDAAREALRHAQTGHGSGRGESLAQS